ncbi:hypothetical protein SAMN05443662_0631 [Sulfurivirga caldicuralii]|uniref:Tetratricopeptide repeat-containing protein n=1 Tax=Sulfurivirga caldicuralii TaxID=364032 RepID=A0A1N6EJ55_9GAMM|nr:tetratricopeptide repeat protein [Sulfurivirga caldicuralii]SIN83007.1 hypothetical protein SAMN05443662_0631 [Sulfurivirga caldicuralii]
MSVLLEALKKAAEQRAAADAKVEASDDGGVYTAVEQPHTASSNGCPINKDDELPLHSAMQPQQADDSDVPEANETGASPSGIPLKIKFPISEAPDDKAAGERQAVFSSDDIEDNKHKSSFENAQTLQHYKPFTELRQADLEPSDTAYGFAEADKVATKPLGSHPGRDESVRGSAFSDALRESEGLKFVEESELLSSSDSEEWGVPDADNTATSPEDIDFVPSQLSEDKVGSTTPAMPDKAAASTSHEEIGTDGGFQVQDPSVLLRSRKSGRRISPSVLLLALLIVMASVAVIWGYYQNTQPALPNRYAHIADRHEHELTVLSDAGKPKEVPERSPSPQEVHSPVMSERGQEPLSMPNVEKIGDDTQSESQENPTENKKLSEAATHKAPPILARTDAVKKKEAEEKAPSGVAQLNRREDGKPLTSYPRLKKAATNQTQIVSLEQCFEQLIREATQGDACNHIDNASIRLAFEAYRLFSAGQVERARRLVHQAYSTAPYNIYVAQIYALIGGEAIPLEQLASLHEIFPGAVTIALQLANRYVLSGNLNKALDVLMLALEEHPRNGYLLYNAALVAYEMDKKNLASDLLSRIPANHLQIDSQLGQAVHDLEAVIGNG